MQDGEKMQTSAEQIHRVVRRKEGGISHLTTRRQARISLDMLVDLFSAPYLSFVGHIIFITSLTVYAIKARWDVVSPRGVMFP